ncbi:non-canonical purine NTP pyrophosphatase [Polaromonas sp.]|nr:non-canonical purine NTP pyrophosphatase [Candidatus Saccharibacteria bacterium]
MKFTIVTGNVGKLAEFKRLIPADISYDHQAIDLPEIQSLSSEAIIRAKITAAYDQLKKPVLVEDVTAGLDNLGGLPGPFIKFFEQQLGYDALFQLRGEAAATVCCTIGYYDGTNLVITSGTVHGMAVASKGEYGFGFDACFAPNGQTKTYGQMEPAEKDAVSHRALAVADLLEKLKQL